MSAGAAVRMYSLAAAAALRATPAAALRAAPAAALRAAPAASALRASHPPHVGLDNVRDSNRTLEVLIELEAAQGSALLRSLLSIFTVGRVTRSYCDVNNYTYTKS